MNSFGRLFRISILGESHGEVVGVVIDGCPAGLPLQPEHFSADLDRRRGGMQKGTTPRKEDDIPKLLTGVFNGKTTGAPLTILFENKNVRSEDYEKLRDRPRPGHADLVATIKAGGYEDHRGGGHYSGRLTVALVAAGVVAKRVLALGLTSSRKDILTSPPNPLSKGEGGPDLVVEDRTSPPNPLSEGEGGPTPLFEDRITTSGQFSGEQANKLPGEPLYWRTAPGEWEYMSKFAKQKRKNPTEAEKRLWKLLRNRKLDGFKFRRQHPINVFIPDFVCLEKNLVIEIDGEYHLDENQKKYDELRDNWFREFNYRVVRLTNQEVLDDPDSALNKIRTALLDETHATHQQNLREWAASPSPLERGVGGEVIITATILEIGGEPDLDKGIQKAIEAKDSVGGIIECRVGGLPAGLGEPFFDSVESVISHLVFSIPAIKAIEFGAGFQAARMFGSEHNDAFIDREGRTRTNNAGGVLAGLTNGNELLFRVAVKPTSSTPKEQESINLASGQVEKMVVKGRHDLCIALRVPVVLEAVTALALVDLLMLEQRVGRRL